MKHLWSQAELAVTVELMEMFVIAVKLKQSHKKKYSTWILPSAVSSNRLPAREPRDDLRLYLNREPLVYN